MATALGCAGFVAVVADSGESAMREYLSHSFDAMLLDIDMPGNRELEFLQQLRDQQHDTPAVILTGRPTLRTAVDAVRLGVVEYVTKPASLDSLFEKLDRAVWHGRMVRAMQETEDAARLLSQRLQSIRTALRATPSSAFVVASREGPGEARPSDPLGNLPESDRNRLSRRESEVLTLMTMGHAPQEVAAQLHLSTNTVRNHLKNIFIKLRVNSQLALLAKVSGAHAR